MKISLPAITTALSLALTLGLTSTAAAAPAALSTAPAPTPAAAPDAPQEQSKAPDFDFKRIKKTQSLELEVGKKALIHLGATRRFAVMDSNVVKLLTHPDGDKIVVEAKTPGQTMVGVGRVGFEITVKVKAAAKEDTLSASRSPL